MSHPTPVLSAETRDQLDQVIASENGRSGALLTILEKAQESEPSKHLPKPMLDYVARSMGIPLSQIQSVATFYSFFNLEPQGRHTVAICRGTACHTRGSKELLDKLTASLDFPPGATDKAAMTTRDMRLTVRTVACIGQCALAPVVEVDGDIYGHIDDRELKQVLNGLPEEGS